jgi:4-hydroxy-tetrahydrodipicolinate synthase
MASGAVGVISVASNLVPARVCDLVNAATRRDYEEARKIHYELYSLFKDLFLEPNPVPVKYALAKQGLMQADVRLPLCELSAGSIAKLETTLRALQLA